MGKLRHDKALGSYILDLENGYSARVDYEREGEHLRLVYSEVPAQLRGSGVGKTLVEDTFAMLTEEGFTATAVCSYVRLIAQRSAKWRDIIQ